MAIEFEAQNL